MIRIREAILVEGRYDKNTLAQIVDAPIFQTDGFGIMKDRKKQEFLRRLAETRGLVILTDSDGAGLLIRSRLKSILPVKGVYHAYIPDIAGKEKRKSKAGKAGLLGVEGMPPEILLNAIRNSGAHILEEDAPRVERGEITPALLYELGLSGGSGSKERRRQLLQHLALPENLGTGALRDALGCLMDADALRSLVAGLSKEKTPCDTAISVEK